MKFGIARIAATRWSALLIALAGLAAYSGSLRGPLLFDDADSIVENQSLRSLRAIGAVLSPPSGGITVSGRPILNLSLALNFAAGGLRVEGYHLTNVAIHLLAGLALFGIARRTLPSRPALAFAIALLWTLHPIQTESVTYVIQRAESLMGLLYLLAMYCFIRYAAGAGAPVSGSDPARVSPRVWALLSIVACTLGMATKEVMVSAPLVILLYDRTFVSGSFREAWRRHRGVHLGLSATWILLGVLVIGEGGARSGSVGFGTGVSEWSYGLTQFKAVVTYLRLSLWPHPLVFEYGTFWVGSAVSVLPHAVLVLALASSSAVALWRWPAWGFLGFWFFAILAPTSLVPGTTQMIVEHRMYLALAPVIAAVAVSGDWVLRHWLNGREGMQSGITDPPEGLWAGFLILVACAFGVLTAFRNEVYRHELSLWADTVAKRPENALAHNNLGTAVERQPGRLNDAIAEYREALRLKPDFPEAHNNLGNALAKLPGRLNDAIAEYREALRLRPGFAAAHDDLGNALSRIPGRLGDAIAEYAAVVRLKPDNAGGHNNLGRAWLQIPGKREDAIAEFREALRLNPDFAEAHNNLGNAWATMPGKLNDAIAEFREAVRLNPGLAEAHNNLGNALSNVPGRVGDAIAEVQEALRLNPDYPEAHNNLGNCWAGLPGMLGQAVDQYRAALRLRPDYAEARFNLAAALLHDPSGRDEAVRELEAFLRLRPDNQEARRTLDILARPPGP